MGVSSRSKGELAAARRWLRAIAETSLEPIAIVGFGEGPAFTFEWVSDAVQELLGRDAEALLRLPSVLDVVAEADRSLAREQIAVLRSGGVADTQLRIRAKDRHRLLRVLARPMWNDDGSRVVGCCVAAQDLSTSKRAKPLDELRALPEHILSDANEGVLVIDRELRYRFWNPRMERITGVPKEKVIGNTPWQIFPFLHDSGLDVLLGRVFEGEHVVSEDFEYTVPSTKQSGWAVQRMGPLRDARGEVTAALVFVTDITERKRNEQTIRRQLAEIASYYDHAPVGLAVLNEELRFVRLNETFAKMLGIAGDAVGKTVGDVVKVIEPATRDAVSRIVRTGKAVTDVELGSEVPGEPGAIRTWVAGWHPLYDDGKVTAFTVTLLDVTERQQGERERDDLRFQLAQSQKMEAVGSLAGGMAHDFNNVLMLTSAHVDAALAALREDDPARESLVEIHKAVQRGARLTRQLLAFSRRQVLRPEALELDATVAVLVPMLQRLLGDDIELETSLGAAGAHVVADRGQIEQVLMNLVVNARDALPNGGTITIETGTEELDARDAASRSLPPGRYVRMSVTDDGVGMDEATSARCFEPFFTTKERGKGTGLGLSTTYGIVRQSGGAISVASRLGSGTTFVLRLPRVDQVSAPPPSSYPETVTRGGETVLLVEDEPMILRVVRANLERAGYVVLTAPSGDEALRVARDRDFAIDLVVTDVVMPKMSGQALVERLRAEKPDLAVLFMSGYTADVLGEEQITGAATAYIAKPFATGDLLRKIRGVLESRARTA